jgi:hypothetical protein
MVRLSEKPPHREIAGFFGHHHCQRRKYQPHRSFEDASIKV